MAETSKKFSELPAASSLNDSDLFMISQGSQGSGWASLRTSLLALADKIVSGISFTSALQTTNKTITGAINEAAQSGGSDAIADEFDPTQTYTVGEYVMHEGSLYKCTTAVSVAGQWDANDWTETLVMDEVEESGGGGTTVIANPTGTPTDELETIQIGNDIYEVVGGGSGSAEWTDVIGTLEAGETEIVLTSGKIKTTSAVFPWTDKFGVAPTNMVVANGSATLTFPAQSSDMGVMVRVSKVNTGHTYDIDLSHLQADKSWFYYDNTLSSVSDTGDGLQLSGNDTRNDWTTSATVGINIANMIGTIPVGLTALKLHFKTFEMDGYTGVRFINSNTLFTGQAGGADTMLKTAGFYQFENNNSSIIEDDYEITVPCTASNLANTYLYIMFFDGMITGNMSNYSNNLNGAYNIIIDGIDYVTGGN